MREKTEREVCAGKAPKKIGERDLERCELAQLASSSQSTTAQVEKKEIRTRRRRDSDQKAKSSSYIY